MLNGGATPTLDPNQALYPGQVDGQGCVQPTIVQNIGDQLDALHTDARRPTWREYAAGHGQRPGPRRRHPGHLRGR